MLCTSRMHPLSLGNYLGTSLIIGNLMRIRVTSVEWTWEIQYKKKFLQWVLSQYDDATLNGLRKVVPNIKHAIIWSYEVWSELDVEIVRNCWRMARILPSTWNVDFRLGGRKGEESNAKRIR